MKRVLFLLFLLTGFGVATATQALADANLTVSPSSGSHGVNSTIDVNVILDTGGAAATGADFVLTFPAANLEIQSASDVSYGSAPLFTSNTPARDNANGKITSISTMSVATNTFSGKGTLATIKFKVKAAGTAALRFECSTGSRSDTNVWSAGSDIVNCDQTTGASFTLTSGGGDGGTSTPKPSATLKPMGAPTTTSSDETKGGLPNSGTFEVTLALGAGGLLLLALGFFFPRFLRS